MPDAQSSWYSGGLAGAASSVMSALSVVSQEDQNLSRPQSMNYNSMRGSNSVSLGSELGNRSHSRSDLTQKDLSSIDSLVYAGRDPLASGFRTPTIRDIPQLALPRVPTVDESVFDEYLKEMDGDINDMEYADLEPVVAITTEAPGTMAPSDILAAHSLETVPKVFFEPEFDLDNPRIFNLISNNIQEDDAGDDGDEPLDSAMLQENLSWCIDCIELHLISEIARASGTFFSITSQFTALENQSKEVSSQVAKLRMTLDDVQKEVVDYGLASLEYGRELEKALALAAGVSQIQQLLEAVRDLEALLEVGKHSEALNMLPQARALANGTVDIKDNNIGVTEATALSDLPALVPTLIRLNDIGARVGEQFRLELFTVLGQDLKHALSVTPPELVLARLSRVLQPKRNPSTKMEEPYLETDSLRNQLEEILNGSNRVDMFEATLRSCTDQALVFVEQMFEEKLPASLSTRDPVQLSAAVHQMSYEETEKMLRSLYLALCVVLKRLSTQQKLLLDVASAIGPPPAELMNITESAVLYCDTRLARLLKSRKNQISSATLRNFLGLYALTGMFMSDCESTCGTYPPELSQLLQQEIRVYMANSRASQLSKMMESLNMNIWRKEKVPATTQLIINRILESAALDPAEWIRIWRTVIDGVQYGEEGLPSTQESQVALIDRDSFYTSSSLLKLIRFIESDLQLLTLLPQTTQDMSNLLLDLLRQYNERTRSLVLGTDAMRSGSGLKRITFRQLSQASEDIGFLMSLLPSVIKTLKRHLPPIRVSIVEEFTALLANLTKHQEDIYQKFVGLMREKLDPFCAAILSANFSAEALPANTYMQSMVKDLSAAAHILNDSLSSKSAVQQIMTQIFNVYRARLLETFTSLRLVTPAQKANLLCDIDFFRKKLSNVTGADNVGEIIYMSIDEFTVTDHTPTPRQSSELPQHSSLVSAQSSRPNTPASDVTSGQAPDIETKNGLHSDNAQRETLAEKIQAIGLGRDATSTNSNTEEQAIPEKSQDADDECPSQAPDLSNTATTIAGNISLGTDDLEQTGQEESGSDDPTSS